MVASRVPRNGVEQTWSPNILFCRKILKWSILLLPTLAVFFFYVLKTFDWQLWLSFRLASLARLYLDSCVIISPLGDVTLPHGRCALAGASRGTEPQLQWGTASKPKFFVEKKAVDINVFRNRILDRVTAFSGKLVWFFFPWRKPQFSVEKHCEGSFLSSLGQQLLRSNLNWGVRNECSRSCPFLALTASVSEMLTVMSSWCGTLFPKSRWPV